MYHARCSKDDHEDGREVQIDLVKRTPLIRCIHLNSVRMDFPLRIACVKAPLDDSKAQRKERCYHDRDDMENSAGEA